MTGNGLVGRIVERCLAGERVGREELVSLLSIDAESAAAEPVFEAGREAARRFGNNVGRIGGSIGINWAPCPMNCEFCGQGEKWGIARETGEMPVEAVLGKARKFWEAGAHRITLRTTEDYPLERLCDLGREVRKIVGNDIDDLTANTGELDEKALQRLREAGFTRIYHVMRMREGIDTAIDPQERRRTLAAIRDSGLNLSFLVDPIGPEHTPEELADVFLCALEYGASASGAMARVPVPGTPLARHGQIGDRKHAFVSAITRLAGGRQTFDICAHPHSELAARAGANVVVAEIGAIPRDVVETETEWQSFTVADARNLLTSAGYNLAKRGELL